MSFYRLEFIFSKGSRYLSETTDCYWPFEKYFPYLYITLLVVNAFNCYKYRRNLHPIVYIILADLYVQLTVQLEIREHSQ